MTQFKQLLLMATLSVNFIHIYANDQASQDENKIPVQIKGTFLYNGVPLDETKQQNEETSQSQDEKDLTQFIETTEIHPEFENGLAFLHEQNSKALNQLSQQAQIMRHERKCIENTHSFLQELKSNDSDAIKSFAQKYETCKHLFKMNEEFKELAEAQDAPAPTIKNLGDLLRSSSFYRNH